MLSWPKAIGTQSEQKLHDFLVRARTYIIICGVDGSFCPRQHRPILVVDKESAVLHGRFFDVCSVALNKDARHRGGFHVGPPNIGRNADSTADFEESVRRSARCAAHDDESLADAFGRILHELKCVSFPNACQPCGIDLPVGNEAVEDGRLTDGPGNDGEVAGVQRIAHPKLLAGDGFYVVDNTTGNRCDHFGIVRIHDKHGVCVGSDYREIACRLRECQISHSLQASGKRQENNRQIS